MHEPLTTVVGNVARVPKLRNVASGAFVADFRVASTPRRLDKGTGVVPRPDALVRRHLQAQPGRERRGVPAHRRRSS